jgi:Ca2+-binding RTX toxin-like protein
MRASTSRLAPLLALVLLALMLPAAAHAVDVVSLGGDVELRMGAGDDVEVLVDGLLVDSQPCCADYAVQGAETLTITNPPGGIIPVHVTFDGHALLLSGGAADSGSAAPGSVVYRRGSGTQTIEHTALETVTDTVASPILTLEGTPGADAVTIGDSALPGGLTIASPTFPSYSFTNKASVSLDTLEGDDPVAMANTSPPTGLTGDFTVKTGGTITVGDADYTGARLVLRTPGAIVDPDGPGGVSVTAARLSVHAASVDLDTWVADLDADLSGAATVRNAVELNLGGLTAPGGFDVQAPAIVNSSAITGAGGRLRADRMRLAGGSIDVGSARLALGPAGDGRAIDLGSTADSAADALELSDAELATITAGEMALSGGAIRVSQAVAPPHLPLLTLFAQDFSGGGSISVGRLAITDTSSAGRSWTIDPTSAGQVPLSNVGELSVTGGSGPDTFAVRASASTTFRIDGAAAADTLVYDREGRMVGGDTLPPDGAISSPGVRDVAFTGIEKVRIPCSACNPPVAARGACANPLTGTPGADAFGGTVAGDAISGGAGDDVINALAGDDCLSGDGGDDTLFGDLGRDGIRGADGDDRLFGGRGGDPGLRGGRGDDRVSGGDGDDDLYGDGGADRLTGGRGADELRGGEGNDVLKGSEGRNHLLGGRGADRLLAGNGVREVVDCGPGIDSANVDLKDIVRGCEHAHVVSLDPLARRQDAGA